MKLGAYRVKLRSEALYPLLVLIFAISYYVQIRGLSAKSLLFAAPLLYLCVGLALYLFLREGINVEKFGAGDADYTEGMRAAVRSAIRSHRRMIGVCVGVLIYLLLLPSIGFILGSLVFLFFGMLLLGERRARVLLLVPLATVGFMYFLFIWWLRAPLPQGILGSMLYW